MRGTAKDQQEIRAVEAIVAGYQPDRIVLFGSFAYGRPNGDSDIDLLIVKETADSKPERRALTRRPRARLTHDVTELLDEAQGWWPELVRHRALGARLTRYYQARYPMQELPLDQETLSGDLAAVETLLSELASLAAIAD